MELQNFKSGIEIISDERRRQIEVKGWTSEHDDMHVNAELSAVAACYAMPHHGKYGLNCDIVERLYPIKTWHIRWWNPAVNAGCSFENKIRDLAKAGALIAAEIDRLQRLIDKSNLGKS